MTTGGETSEFVIPGGGGGIAVGPDNSAIWVTGFTVIDRLSLDGKVLTSFGLTNQTWAVGFVTGPDGNLWFTEPDLYRGGAGGARDVGGVGKVTPGGVVTEYPINGAGGASIIAGPQGNLWLILKGAYAEALAKLSLQGVVSQIATWYGTLNPVSLATGPDGNVWFTANNADFSAAYLCRITLDGVVTQYAVPTPNANVVDIVTGPDGNLWFTEYNANKIGRMTPQGVFTEFPVPTPSSQPAAICVGPDGNIWFTESNVAKVGRLALSGPASGKVTLTVPTAASKAGWNGTLFHTDLWLMNRSYGSPALVTLVYRCFAGQGCGIGTQVLSLAPRQEIMLADVIGGTLLAPGTAGTIEISWPTSSGPVSASSKISSPLPPAPEFGTMIPALPQSAARMRALFLGLAWGGNITTGSRSNAGAYNPNETPVDATFTLRDGDGTLLGAVTRTYAPQEAYQLSPNIFDLVGAGSVVTSNAYLVVTATAPVFPYVSVVDNVSGDSSFLPVSDDEAEPQ
ncbi:MAG: hypothetical protein ACHQPI_04265 [Thermoanaerobaculia bacterium]